MPTSVRGLALLIPFLGLGYPRGSQPSWETTPLHRRLRFLAGSAARKLDLKTRRSLSLQRPRAGKTRLSPRTSVPSRGAEFGGRSRGGLPRRPRELCGDPLTAGAAAWGCEAAASARRSLRSQRRPRLLLGDPRVTPPKSRNPVSSGSRLPRPIATGTQRASFPRGKVKVAGGRGVSRVAQRPQHAQEAKPTYRGAGNPGCEVSAAAPPGRSEPSSYATQESLSLPSSRSGTAPRAL